jgi:riboflavin kinase/FMN adenylyltransferase
VYAVKVFVAGQYVDGACNIGYNPTFGGTVRTVEVFLLDFSRQIYEQSLEIHFVQRLRSVRIFSDAAALKAQISLDVTEARRILKNPSITYKSFNLKQAWCEN